MDKFKLMIVDDEAEVREGIIRHIDWAALGFELVAEAENGKDALEKADSCAVDVVLTDIRMPYMDGLAMSAILSERHPAIKIIILTGFDEFDFAKAAVKLNAVEYLLKPINGAELCAVMERVARELSEEFLQKRNTEALQLSYEKALPLMRERYLNELLWGIADYAQSEAQAKRFGITLFENPYKIVAVFEPEYSADDSSMLGREFAPFSIRQIAEENLRERCQCEVFVGTSAIIAMTSWSQAATIDALMHAANEICSRCKRVLGITLTAGIGRAHDEADGMHQSFLGARAALEYKAVVGGGRAIYIQDMEQTKSGIVAFDSRREQQFESVIKFGTHEQIRHHMQDILSKSKSLDTWAWRAYLLGVLNAIFRLIQQYGLGSQLAVTERIQALINLHDGWNDSAELCERLVDVAACMGEYMSARRETAAKTLVAQAKRYMEENYHNSSLSVERLCRHLHVSQSYFFTIFKQETGSSYLSFLTETRMQHAIRLLRETDYKTYVIAEMVGYEEPNYFSYVFKKRFGMSPTKYRK